MAEEFLTKCGKQPASGAGSAALNIESLAMVARSTRAAPDMTEAKGDPAQRPLPPVEQWNPPFCGDIDMRIARDGTWFYCGTPIGRPALVRLFSTILRKDPERYVLVTPVERVGIKVEDAPFLAAEMTVTGEEPERILRFLTNVGDWVQAGAGHPLRFEKGAAGGVKPYVLVRGGLWALVTRAVSLDLVELSEIREHAGKRCFGVVSAGSFFPMASAQEAGDIGDNEAVNPVNGSWLV